MGATQLWPPNRFNASSDEGHAPRSSGQSRHARSVQPALENQADKIPQAARKYARREMNCRRKAKGFILRIVAIVAWGNQRGPVCNEA